MSGTTADARGWEAGTSVGGFVGTGLFLNWVGSVQCPVLAPPGPFGVPAAPPDPQMCALPATAFSRSGLVDQLVLEGFSQKQACGVSKTGL